MAAEKGRAFLLKVGDGATAEQFNTIGGARSTKINFANEAVDVTDKLSNGDRELLESAGTKTRSISGSGVFKDTAAETTMRGYAQDGSINNFQVVFEAGDYYQGAFQVADMNGCAALCDALPACCRGSTRPAPTRLTRAVRHRLPSPPIPKWASKWTRRAATRRYSKP